MRLRYWNYIRSEARLKVVKGGYILSEHYKNFTNKSSESEFT